MLLSPSTHVPLISIDPIGLFHLSTLSTAQSCVSPFYLSTEPSKSLWTGLLLSTFRGEEFTITYITAIWFFQDPELTSWPPVAFRGNHTPYLTFKAFQGMSPASLPSFPEPPSTQRFRDSELLFFVSWAFLHPWFSFHQCTAKFQCSTQMLPFPGSQAGFSSEIPQPLRTSLILGVSESTAWSTVLRVFSWKVVPASRCEGSGEWNGEGGKANTGRIAELATIPRLKESVLGLSAWGNERRPLFQVGHVCPKRVFPVTSPCDVRGRQGRMWEAHVTPSHLVPSSYTCGKLVRVCAELVTLSLSVWRNCQGVLKWHLRGVQYTTLHSAFLLGQFLCTYCLL